MTPAPAAPLYADMSQAGLPWEEDRQPFAWEDRTPADGGSSSSDDSDREPVQQAVPSTSRRRPVWDDPDDAAAEVNIAAQARLRKLRKTERDGIVSGRHTKQTLSNNFFGSLFPVSMAVVPFHPFLQHHAVQCACEHHFIPLLLFRIVVLCWHVHHFHEISATHPV